MKKELILKHFKKKRDIIKVLKYLKIEVNTKESYSYYYSILNSFSYRKLKKCITTQQL